MFSPGFLPRVLPQYFYNSVLHVCRCFNRGCSFFSSGCSGVFFHIRFLCVFRLVLRYCCYPANLLFSGVFCYDFRWDTVLLLVSVGSLPRLVFIYVPPAYALLVPRYFSRRFLLFSPISHHVGRCHIGSWLRGLCVTCFIYGLDQFLLLEKHFYMQIMCCNIIEKHSSLPRIRLSPFVIIMFSSHYGNITKIIFWYELKILRQAR